MLTKNESTRRALRFWRFVGKRFRLSASYISRCRLCRIVIVHPIFSVHAIWRIVHRPRRNIFFLKSIVSKNKKPCAIYLAAVSCQRSNQNHVRLHALLSRHLLLISFSTIAKQFCTIDANPIDQSLGRGH